MPKANITDIEARQMRVKRRIEQREKEKKLRELEKQQQLAKEEAERAKKQLAKAEEYENNQFIIREAETDEEKRKRLEAKKQKFYDEFQPDFDLDEVPPLE